MTQETYTHQPTLSPPNHPHKRLQAIYEAERAAYTAPLLIRTSKPRKKKVRQAEVEQIKNRVETIEGEVRPEDLPEGKTPSWGG